MPLTSANSTKWVSLLAVTGSCIALVDSALFMHHVNFALNAWLNSFFAIVSFAIYRFHKVSSRGLTNLLTSAATVVISVQIAFGYGHDPAILGIVFYVWIALYTFAFLSVRDSLFQLSWIVICYSLALLFGDKPTTPLADWILTVSTVVIASVSAGYLTYTIQQIATTDALTGVNNRKGWEIAAKCEIERARRNDYLVALMMIDLNNFKQINDEMGHDSGDRVLVGISTTLKDSLRPFDVIARWGGDEFVILASVDTTSTANSIIARLYACGAAITPLCCGSVVSVPSTKLDDLICIADRQLYSAKHHPSSRCEIEYLLPQETHSNGDS